MVSLRKLALTLSIVVLISVTLFVPCVKADIVQTTEFWKPVKNSSFEDRDYDIPGDGVYSCPPWESNYAGCRDLEGDVDGDGEVSGYDLTRMTGAYGSTPGEDNWDAACDLNGDAIIDGFDLTPAMGEYEETVKRVHGAYSWYTSGGGDYEMWQNLDSDAISSVKHKKITFAFYFLPQSITPDGSQNYARAEIHYEYRVKLNGEKTEVVEQYGDWVYPTEAKWYTAFVTTTYLPSTTKEIKVVIHGKEDFKAWIDQTSLSISETSLIEDDYGKVSLAVNLFESKDRDLYNYPCRAFIGIAMSADNTWGNMWIQKTEIKLKFIRGGWVTITNVTQSNDKDYSTDPDQTERVENRHIVAAQVAAGLIVTGSAFILGGPLVELPELGVLVFEVFTGTGVSLSMSNWRSDADDDHAGVPGEYAKARLDYGDACPDWANMRCLVELAFGRGVSVGQVEVSAKADYFIGLFHPILYATLETSMLVTVAI